MDLGELVARLRLDTGGFSAGTATATRNANSFFSSFNASAEKMESSINNSRVSLVRHAGAAADAFKAISRDVDTLGGSMAQKFSSAADNALGLASAIGSGGILGAVGVVTLAVGKITEEFNKLEEAEKRFNDSLQKNADEQKKKIDELADRIKNMNAGGLDTASMTARFQAVTRMAEEERDRMRSFGDSPAKDDVERKKEAISRITGLENEALQLRLDLEAAGKEKQAKQDIEDAEALVRKRIEDNKKAAAAVRLEADKAFAYLANATGSAWLKTFQDMADQAKRISDQDMRFANTAYATGTQWVGLARAGQNNDAEYIRNTDALFAQTASDFGAKMVADFESYRRRLNALDDERIEKTKQLGSAFQSAFVQFSRGDYLGAAVSTFSGLESMAGGAGTATMYLTSALENFKTQVGALKGFLDETAGRAAKMAVGNGTLGSAYGALSSGAGAGAALGMSAGITGPLFAPLFAGVGGLSAGMLELSSHTKSYTEWQRRLERATQPLVDAMEPLWQNMLPATELFFQLNKGISVLLGALLPSQDIARGIFDSQKAFALGVLNMAIAAANVQNAMNAVGRGMIDLYNTLNDVTGAADINKNGLQDMDRNALMAQRDVLQSLTYSGTMAAESLSALADAANLNVPVASKISYQRYLSLRDENGNMSTDAGGMNRADTMTINIYGDLHLKDVDELQEKARRGEYLNRGTSRQIRVRPNAGR